MGRRTRTERVECPNLRNHTPAPEGCAAWHHWAEHMTSDHHQVRCPGCNRMSIWVANDGGPTNPNPECHCR